MKSVGTLFLLLSCLSLSLASTRIIGYWGASPGGHASSLPQLQTALNKGYNVIIYAFYDVDANGNFNQDPGSVPAPKKSQIGNSDFVYLVSLFGGENGSAPSITMAADQWAKAMFNSFMTLHSQLGIDGIDIDLENVWGGTPDTVECGLRTFFALMHNSSFFVSMAPQTTAVTNEVGEYVASSWNSYVPLLDTGIIDYVDIVAVQLYNNAVPGNSAEAYAQSLESGFSVTGCPASFGYPAGSGAAPSGCPGMSGGCPYGSSLSSLYNGSPTLSSTTGVMTWSVEWDEASNWQFVSAATQINFRN